MRLARYFIGAFFALALALGVHSSSAGVHGVAYDTLLVPILGDSNTGSGQNFDAALDTTTSTLFQVTRSGFAPSTISVAREPLAELSMSANQIGGTTKLVQLLIAGGHVPPNVKQIILVPTGWAGTGLNLAGNSAWNVAGTRDALDGGGSLPAGAGMYGMINAALAAHPTARIWFFVWIEGANDGGMSGADWLAAVQALFSEIRGVYASAINAPILVTGIPPDRTNTSLGNQTNAGGIVTQQQNIALNLSKAIYVDPTTPTILHSYLANGFVHYSAASHRGGADNSDTAAFVWAGGTTYNLTSPRTCVLATDTFIYCSLVNGNIGNDPSGNAFPASWSKQWQYGQTISSSLADRSYAALLAAGF